MASATIARRRFCDMLAYYALKNPVSIKIVNVQEAFQIISFYPLFYLLVVVINMSCVMFCGSVQSHIAAARAESGPHNHMGRIRIKIRRDHITEDAFSQLNDVSADALKGTVMNLTSLDSGYLVDATSRMFCRYCGLSNSFILEVNLKWRH